MRVYPVFVASLAAVVLGVACSGIYKSAQHRKFVQIAVWEDQATLHGGDLPAFLKDPDVEVRRRAALAIARVGDTMAATALADALVDGDTLVRARCALALGYINHRPITPRIYQRIKTEDNGFVLEHLLWAIGRLYGQEYGDSLMTFLSHPDARVRSQAAMIMNFIVYRPALGRIAGLFNDPDPFVRGCALASVGYLEPQSIAASIAAKLDDPDVWVRGLAVLALGSTQDTAYQPRLVALLNSPERWVRLCAAQGIGYLRDTLHLEEVYPFLQTETDPSVLGQLVESIGMYWQSKSAPYLEKLTHHPDVGVRVKVVTALLRSLQGNAFDALKPFADDPAWAVRALLPTQLEFISRAPGGRNAPTVEMMKRLAVDSMPGVRASAIKSAMAFGGAMRDPVAAGLNDPDPLVRFYALNIFPFAGGKVPFDSLLLWYRDHQDDPRPDVRMALLALTGNLSPSVQIGEIQRKIFDLGMTDRDRLVRQYAAAVWLKFREDHRDQIGAFDSGINEQTYDDYYRVYPAPPRVRLVTQQGEFVIELYPDETPRSVHHFLNLVQAGFYDHTPVGLNDNGRNTYLGDRRGDSWGTCDETLRDEITTRRTERGSLVWYADRRHEARSVFGICLVAQPLGDFTRTVFGKVVEGMDVVDRLRPLDMIEKAELVPGPIAGR